MADIPRVQPLPALGTIQPIGVGAGLSSGLSEGSQMGYQAAQTKALELQNKYAPATLALKQQEIQMQMQKQEAEIKKQKIDSALGFLGQVGEKVKFFTPEAQKRAIANGMNALADAAPEWGIQKTDPTQIPDEGVDLIQQFGMNHAAYKEGKISEADYKMNGQMILTKMTEHQREMMKESGSILGEPSYEAGLTPDGAPASFNTKTGLTTNPQGQPMPGVGFVPAATAASTAAENQRKTLDENDKYKTSVTPFINAHNSFKNMQKIVNVAGKSGSNVDPWSFLNSYVHTVDPNFNGVLNPQTYKDLRIAGSPIIASLPWGEKYLTTSQLDPNDAMQMLKIAKGQDRLYTKTAGDYADMTRRHIQSLGGDSSIVKDFMADAPIVRKLKSGRTAISHDGGVTWQPQ